MSLTMFPNTTLKTRLSLGFVTMLCFTVIVGLAGYLAMEKVIDKTYLYMKINVVRDNFVTAKDKIDEYMRNNFSEGRKAQAAAAQEALTLLDKSASLSTDLMIDVETDTELGQLLDRAFSEINQFKYELEQHYVLEMTKAKITPIYRNVNIKLLELFRKGWKCEDMTTKNELFFFASAVYFDRNTAGRQQTADVALTALKTSISEWRKFIENSDALRSLGAEIQKQFDIYQDRIDQYNVEVASQRKSTRLMVNHEKNLDDTFSEIGRYTLAEMKSVGRFATVVILGSIICALFLGLLDSIRLTSSIVKPIGRLAEVARDIQSGELNKEAHVDSQDEIGQLATSFNSMTHQLRQSLESLKTEVVERTRAEESLQEAHDQLELRVEERTSELTAANESLVRIKQAVEGATDAVGMSTPEGIHFYQNKAFDKMFGYETPEELATDGGGSVLYADKSVAEAVFRAIKAGGSWTGEVTMVPKDGGELVVLLRADAIKDESGKTIGLVGIHTDITERKQAEKELKAAKEAAEAATQAKSEFLANMSHEIRTPMNGVIGMTGLLLGTEQSVEQREFTETIRLSGDALLGIINNILDYSKIEAGKLDLEAIDFDLRVAMDEASDLVAIKAHEKGLEYVVIVDPEVPSLLHGDPGRLRQILINLVGNATKFTEKGEVVVKATLEDDNTTHATIRFSVTDTGIGIPKDRMDRLFQSFSQVDSSTTRKYGGTGLGLTISKQLAAMMGGKIGVKSEKGKGSEFWFTVVLEKQPEGREVKIVVPDDIKGKRILIVDDNAINRYVLREQLHLWGCRHGEAASGMQALEELRLAIDSKDPYEIAILDMQMPEMSGETLGQMIKQDPDLKNTILVMMTSMGQRGDAKRLEKIGFAAYLTKPVKQSQFYDCLAAVSGLQKKAQKDRPAAIVTRHSLTEDQKRRVHILLAEDNIINQKVAISILGKLGYSADAVANGKEAVSALEMIPYDIVLMDCQMPEMDGYEATREIRKPESKVLDHKVPVIAMTAHAMKGDREKCLKAGMDDYLSKPVMPQELSDMLEKWIAKKGSSQQEEAIVSDIDPVQDIFDKAGLLDRLMGDKELANEILGEFMEDVPRKITALKEALDKDDAPSVQREAHSLKGASANVGAVALQEMACQIEVAGEARDLVRVNSLISKLDEQFEVLEKLVQPDF